MLFDSARERLRKDRLAKLSLETRAALETPSGRRTPEQQELARQADLQLQLLDSQIEREIADDEKPLYESLKKKIAAWEKQLPDRPQTWGFYSPRTSPTSIEVLPMRGFYPLQFEAEQLREARAHLLVRGNAHRRGPAVEAGWPAVLELAFGDPALARHNGSRSAFVDWLVDPAHPLTSRVWANRVWQHHFGRGLVETPGDFGLRGAPPSHPELLDFLAVAGREQGWSTKRLHRLICNSSVYALGADQSSAASSHSVQVFETGHERDPENYSLWRFPSRRLEAESVRDKLLAVAGELDLAAGGPSGDEQTSRRRALYIFQKRDMLPEVQRLFDGANANEPCGRRLVTTVSLQPLFLLNSPFAARMAERFAARVESLAGDDPLLQLETAYGLALGRPPDADERSAALAFWGKDRSPPLNTDTAIQKADAAAEPWSPLRRFCQILMNLNEFAYLE
ncbi:MAG: DUF1553 domain-containing protein [Planctomycetota bacterium]